MKRTDEERREFLKKEYPSFKEEDIDRGLDAYKEMENILDQMAKDVERAIENALKVATNLKADHVIFPAMLSERIAKLSFELSRRVLRDTVNEYGIERTKVASILQRFK